MALNIDSFSEPLSTVLKGHLAHAIPLTRTGKCAQDDARTFLNTDAAVLFPGARDPSASLSGVLLLLGCWDESHKLSQDNASVEGSYWHAIAHRIEPDSWNSGYWFRRVGRHAIFPELNQKAAEILSRSSNVNWRLTPEWNSIMFIEWCEEARRNPGSEKETAAIEIQQAEWELLFQWCSTPARPGSRI